MARRKHKPEEIVAKLRQVDVLTSQGRSVAEAVRTIGVTEVTYFRAVRMSHSRPASIDAAQDCQCLATHCQDEQVFMCLFAYGSVADINRAELRDCNTGTPRESAPCFAGRGYSRAGADPPPLNWSTLRYVFGHEKEDHNAEKAPQA